MKNKMKILKIILILLLSNSAFCQKTYVIDNFSKDYFGKLYIADTKEVFSKGWVAIYDKKTKKQLIRINADELAFTVHDNKVLANINELPYGEQSTIMYNDYNFDGKKDFAIMDGQYSCYHGPSFQIFLATPKGFKKSREFTELAQNYCGMFDNDYKTKIISTMTKSGCCWHQYSEFKVKNNKPYPIKIVEEQVGVSGYTYEYIEQNLVNGKMKKTTFQKLVSEINDENLILTYTFENGKKMQVFDNGYRIFYAFTKTNGNIELFNYEMFLYNSKENTLIFNYLETEYIIYDDKIIANTPKNTYVMKADRNKKGTLKKLKNLKLENLMNK